jgi:hypothetical protein
MHMFIHETHYHFRAHTQTLIHPCGRPAVLPSSPSSIEVMPPSMVVMIGSDMGALFFELSLHVYVCVCACACACVCVSDRIYISRYAYRENTHIITLTLF